MRKALANCAKAIFNHARFQELLQALADFNLAFINALMLKAAKDVESVVDYGRKGRKIVPDHKR